MRCRSLLSAGLVVAFAVLAISVSESLAVPTLVYDFRVNQNASFAQPGVPTGGTLGNGATVSTGTAIGQSTNRNYLVAPELIDGYMTIHNRGTVVSTMPPVWIEGDYMRTAARYTELFAASGNNFGSGTFVTVIRPDFAVLGQRQWFMTHGAAGGASYIGSLSEGRVVSNGGRASENSFGLLNPTAGSFPWQNGDWYMVAMSWQQSSAEDGTMSTCCGNAGLADGKLRSYVRRLTDGGEITPESLAYFSSDDAVRLWHTRHASDPVNNFITLGNRLGFNTGILTEGGTGDYALFQFYNTMFEEDDFDALFNSFLAPVPEPSSLSLSLFGCFALVCRSSRKRRGC